MNRKDIKRRLISQTENLIPDMEESILKRLDEVEILACPKVEKSRTQKRFQLKKALTAVGLSLILVLSTLIGFVLLNDRNQVVSESYIYISINPQVELVSDNNNIIKSARGLNKDGILLLVGEEIVGLDTNTACKKVVSIASRMGYLTEGKKVSISVISKDTETEAKVENEIKEKILIDNSNIEITMSSEAVDEDLEKLAAEKGVSLNKIILAKAAMELDEDLTIDNALLLSTSRLFEKVANYDEAILSTIENVVSDYYKNSEVINSLNERIANKEKEITDFNNDALLLQEDYVKNIEAFNEKYELELGNSLDKELEDYEELLKQEINEYIENRIKALNAEQDLLKGEKEEAILSLKAEINIKISEEETNKN